MSIVIYGTQGDLPLISESPSTEPSFTSISKPVEGAGRERERYCLGARRTQTQRGQ